MSEKRLEFSSKNILSNYDPNSKLKHYFDLLEDENKKINLVSRETSRSDLERLAAESLLPFQEIPPRTFQNYLDTGSGGGFPAFPIIMCLAPKNSVLVERTKKKAAALVRMSNRLNIKISVKDTNFEESKFDCQFDLITLRLVKLTDSLLKKFAGLLSQDGIFIYYSNFEKDTDKLKVGYSSYTYNVGADDPPKHFTIFTRQS